ncbi:MAG: DUF4276 family protein [Alphaproteobacteria bacterium]|nr:DUF4276 family protein [Alphaproteobacteria bacterium]
MMRVLVVGEGLHDIGRQNEWCEQTRKLINLPGWLQTLLHKMNEFGQAIEITSINTKEIVLSGQERRKRQPLPEGHGAKAMAAKLKAKNENFDVVVFMADSDTEEDCKWRCHHKCVQEGFGKIPEGPAGVVCLPKSASESWLLADPEAWKAMGLSCTKMLPSHPETIWGKHDDPEGNRPHPYFARVCKAANRTDTRETRVELMEKISIPRLAKACPLSFASFWNELHAAGIAPSPPDRRP